MRFLLDHDVPIEISRILTRAGHDVQLVAAALNPTALDQDVFNFAVDEGRILVSCNRDDFLGLARDRSHSGLIIVVRRRTRIAECAAMIRLIEKAGSQGLAGNVNFA